MKASNEEIPGNPAAVTIARVLLYSTAAVPLIILLNSFFPYIVPRTLYFRVVVEVSLGLLAYLLIARDWRAQVRLDPFLYAFAAFVAANCLSAVFSPARNRAMFGDFERMGGVWALLHYMLFYALVRVFFGARQWRFFFHLLLAASSLVALIGLFEGAGTKGAASTIGNPGLLGLYLFFGLCISVYLAFQSSRIRWALIYAAAAFINFSALVLSQNRSSLLGSFVAVAVGTTIYLFRGKKHRLWLVGIVTALTIAFAAAMTVVTKQPDSRAAKLLPTTLARIRDSGIKKSDAGRIVFWVAAYEGFKERPLLGYGPENFHLAWSANFQTQVYVVTRDERVDRAHNIVLEVLSTTGIIGFIAFVAMWVAVFVSITAGLRSKVLTLAQGIFFAAVSFGYLVALGFWFIDINSFIPWLAICAFLAHERTRGPAITFGAVQAIDPVRKVIFAGSVLALASSLWLHVYETFRVSRLLYRTQVAASDMPATLHAYFEVFDSPAPQSTHTPMLYGRYMGSIVPRMRPGQLDASTRSLIDTAFARGIVEMNRERKKDPRNELVYLQEARLALLASAYYRLPAYYEYAVKTLREATELSPRRVQPKLVLAYTLMMAKRYDEARATLMQAKAIYPGGQVYYYIGELHRAQNQIPLAVEALDSSLVRGFSGAPSLYYSVIDSLQRRGAYAESARLAEAYLTVLQPDFRSLAPRREPPGNASTVVPLLARLPWLWAKAGDETRAIAAAQSLKAVYPAAASNADDFVRKLSSGNRLEWQQDTTLLARNKALPQASG
ncbi:MAG: O-antigen ligase family protein [Gemmatimonadaceae bacterium]|nr:O-antigen ligase family protein [Gemmatimonadaceae bacterium]